MFSETTTIESTRQLVLLSGMDCLPGQMDLFATDGRIESDVDEMPTDEER